MRLGVIRTIAQDTLWTIARRTPLAGNRWNRINQWQQLSHIMRVGAGDGASQRNTFRVGDDMVLRAGLAAIRRVRSSFFPPKTARTDDESTTARERSNSSRRRSSHNSTAWSSSQIPACCQSRKRRQQVMPQQPNSAGSISQGMPLLSTNRMPVRASRSSTGLRPGCLNRRGGLAGSSGAINVHKSSSSSALAMTLSRNPKRVCQHIMVH